MKYNIPLIKPYKYDTKVEDSSSKNMYYDVNIWVTRHIILSPTKAWNKAYGKISTDTLMLIHIVRAREVLMTTYFLHNRLQLFRIGDALGKGF